MSGIFAELYKKDWHNLLNNKVSTYIIMANGQCILITWFS